MLAPHLLIIPPQCPTHGALCSAIQEMVEDVFTHAGWQVTITDAPGNLGPYTHLLLLGLGIWDLDRHGALLRSAKQSGVRRVLWQLETLPPPDIPASWLTNLLLTITSERPGGLFRLIERIGYRHLAKQCHNQPWSLGQPFERRRFALPFREARKILNLHHNGLIDQILVNLHSRQAFLASQGVPSHYAPLVYHYTFGSPLPDIQRDLDVVFFGTVHSRRRPLLTQVKNQLAKHGYKLTLVERDCYGENRTQLINRAKIILYLRGYPWEMPRMRLLMAMGCKAMVVAEDFPDIHPFQASEHLILAPSHTLAETLLAYLRNDAERARIAEVAYRFLVKELTPEKCLIPFIKASADAPV